MGIQAAQPISLHAPGQDVEKEIGGAKVGRGAVVLPQLSAQRLKSEGLKPANLCGVNGGRIPGQCGGVKAGQ